MDWRTWIKSKFRGSCYEIYLQLTKLNSMDLVMPAKELMVQRSTFVLRTEMATEYPS